MCLFKKYISTTSPKAKLRPLVVKLIADTTKDKVLEYLKANNYENIRDLDDYLDLYAERNGFEVTFEFTKNGTSTIIDISTYTDNKAILNSREFKKIYKDIITLLNCDVE